MPVAFTPSSITGAIGDFNIDANGSWTFTANNSFDYLSVNESINEIFNVVSIDGTSSTVQITINGTNDSPVVTDSVHAVAEDGHISLTERLAIATDGRRIDATGAWTFTANSTFDNLNVGDNVNETFNVTSVDGTASTVQITINGTNDAATVCSSNSQCIKSR